MEHQVHGAAFAVFHGMHNPLPFLTASNKPAVVSISESCDMRDIKNQTRKFQFDPALPLLLNIGLRRAVLYPNVGITEVRR